MNGKQRQRDRTRNKILDALADVIAERGGIGFSIQQVADRAGVTHRTVYNHFPTRDALRDGLEARVEDVMQGSDSRVRDEELLVFERLASLAEVLYADLESHAAASHAQATFVLASGGLPKRARGRTALIRKAIASHLPADAPVSADQAAAAIRMFLSSTGWHLLTAHHGLSPAKAAATAAWAARVLLDAATRGTSRPRKVRRK
jgi:AcrR family transcriptional regulator